MGTKDSTGDLRHAAAHVFVDALEAPDLDETDAHHLVRSLRLRPGEVVTACDGLGGWRVCRFTGSALDPSGEVHREPGPQPLITVGFALAKGEKPEWVVQKLTEVGVDHIRPMLTARTVVRWNSEKAQHNHVRLTRVAREAAMQSRRTWLPRVAPLASFAEVVKAVTAVSSAALAEAGGHPPSLIRPGVLVGPEGGWTPEELAAGLPTVDLGATVLRAETAAMAAGVLLCGLRTKVVTTSE